MPPADTVRVVAVLPVTTPLTLSVVFSNISPGIIRLESKSAPLSVKTVALAPKGV